MIGKLTGIQRLFGGEWVLSFTTKGDAGTIYEKLKDVDVDVDIKKHNPKRSKDANAMCWSLCTDIGKALIIPKEEVYRKAIKDVGEYEPIPIREDAVETFKARWSSHGTGWFAEVVDNSKLKGYKLVFAYYGSSTYDTAAMSRLIDYLVEDARNMGLPIPATKEQEEMLKSWQAKA